MYSLVASNPILFHGVGNQETTFAGLAGVAVCELIVAKLLEEGFVSFQ